MAVLLQARAENGGWDGEPFTKPQIITANFGEPRDNGVGYHTGIDLAPVDGQPGQPIAFSSLGFFILWAGSWNGTRRRDVNGGYGNVLLGRINPQGDQVLIAHMQRFSADIETWINSGYSPHLKPTFSPGEVIGYQGNSGFVWGYLADGSVGVPPDDDLVSGTHTHLEVRNAAGALLNPLSVITGFAPVRESNGLLLLA